MPKVVITGNSSAVVAARIGGDIVLRKTLTDAKVTETHRAATNKRRIGKQKDPEVITLSAADQKALRIADTAALASAKIEHAKDKKAYIAWASKTCDERTANDAAKITAKAKKDENERNEAKAEEKKKRAEVKALVMEGSAKTERNPETKKKMDKYKSQAKLIPKRGYPVPAMK